MAVNKIGSLYLLTHYIFSTHSTTVEYLAPDSELVVIRCWGGGGGWLLPSTVQYPSSPYSNRGGRVHYRYRVTIKMSVKIERKNKFVIHVPVIYIITA